MNTRKAKTLRADKITRQVTRKKRISRHRDHRRELSSTLKALSDMAKNVAQAFALKNRVIKFKEGGILTPVDLAMMEEESRRKVTPDELRQILEEE